MQTKDLHRVVISVLLYRIGIALTASCYAGSYYLMNEKRL